MIDAKHFERTINGKQTSLVTLANSGNLTVTISNYGARIISLEFKGVNVTPSFPSLDAYTSYIAPYHGATVGRYANRIAKGRFTLQTRDYLLSINNGSNHLHGGPGGFHAQVWTIENKSTNTILLHYLSKDGEESFPGNLQVWVSYSVTEADELIITYKAETDAPTPLNLTNHAFFNLNGRGNILDHQLQINADQFTPVDIHLVPTGDVEKVEGTAFDFTHLKPIGQDIDKPEEQLRIGKGYDHNYVLRKQNQKLSFAAKAVGNLSGITMEVYTEEPGLQLFSGNFEAVEGDSSSFRNTFCLETQHFPDSPNQPTFPTTILLPGQMFTSTTVHRFIKL